MLDLWARNYRHEQDKFIRATYLLLEDLHTDFIDAAGNPWTIMGQMENGDMVCRNSSGVHYTWDKWKVSQFKHPEKHVKAKVLSGKMKPVVKEETKEPVQLSISFEEPVEEKIPIVEEEEIGSLDPEELFFSDDQAPADPLDEKPLDVAQYKPALELQEPEKDEENESY